MNIKALPLRQPRQSAPSRPRSLGATITAGELSRSVEVVEPDLPVADLAQLFKSKLVSCLLVRDPSSEQRVGLISKSHWGMVMSGRLGYGWALLSRSRAQDIADWSPLIVESRDPVLDISRRSLARSSEKRYDYVVVRDNSWRILSTGDLLTAYGNMLAGKLQADALTGLLERGAGVSELDRRCIAASQHGARVALVVLKLRGLKKINRKLGLALADQFLQAVAQSLQQWAPTSYGLIRLGGAKIAVSATFISLPDDVQAANAAENLRKEVLSLAQAALSAELAGLDPDTAEAVREMLRPVAAAVVSFAGRAQTDQLLGIVVDRLDQST